jgi:hypothetical protein
LDITRIEGGYCILHGGLLCLPGPGCRSRQCRTGFPGGRPVLINAPMPS